MEKAQHLGFPVPLLGMKPVRLPVLYDDGECISLAKPAGVVVQADSWYPRLPVMIEAIRIQAEQAKPEFVRLNIPPEGLWAVNDLDAELYGPVLYSRDREQAEALRNEYGSEAFTFTYVFLSQARPTEASVECDLPLVRHNHQPRMLVSHTSGKKSRTLFEYDGPVGAFHQWQARILFPRRHQVLLHAYEAGLPILGDGEYSHDSALLLSRFKRGYQNKGNWEERPLYEGPACYLRELNFGPEKTIFCPEPPRWGGLINQLKKHTHP